MKWAIKRGKRGFQGKLGSFLKKFGEKKRVEIGSRQIRSSFVSNLYANMMKIKYKDWRWTYNFRFNFFIVVFVVNLRRWSILIGSMLPRRGFRGFWMTMNPGEVRWHFHSFPLLSLLNDLHIHIYMFIYTYSLPLPQPSTFKPSWDSSLWSRFFLLCGSYYSKIFNCLP